MKAVIILAIFTFCVAVPGKQTLKWKGQTLNARSLQRPKRLRTNANDWDAIGAAYKYSLEILDDFTTMARYIALEDDAEIGAVIGEQIDIALAASRAPLARLGSLIDERRLTRSQYTEIYFEQVQQLKDYDLSVAESIDNLSSYTQERMQAAHDWFYTEQGTLATTIYNSLSEYDCSRLNVSQK